MNKENEISFRKDINKHDSDLVNNSIFLVIIIGVLTFIFKIIYDRSILETLSLWGIFCLIILADFIYHRQKIFVSQIEINEKKFRIVYWSNRKEKKEIITNVNDVKFMLIKDTDRKYFQVKLQMEVDTVKLTMRNEYQWGLMEIREIFNLLINGNQRKTTSSEQYLLEKIDKKMK